MVGDSVSICLPPRVPSAIWEGLAIDGTRIPAPTVQGSYAFCQTIALGSGDNAVTILSHRVGTQDSVTWTPSYIEDQISILRIYPSGVSSNAVNFKTPLRLPRGHQISLCAQPLAAYKTQSTGLSSEGTPRSIGLPGQVCVLRTADQDETVTVATALRDTLTVHFEVEPGLQVLGHLASFDTLIPAGDALTYSVWGSNPLVLFHTAKLVPSQDTTITTSQFDPTQYYRITFMPSHHVTYSHRFDSNLGWLSSSYALVAKGRPLHVRATLASGWKIATVTPADALYDNWIPTADTAIQIVPEPIVPSIEDSIVLIRDPDATYYQFYGYGKNQDTIPHPLQTQHLGLHSYKPGCLPYALKVNGAVQPLLTTGSGNKLYFTQLKRDTALIYVPAGPDVRTLEVLFAPAQDTLTLRLPDNWPAQGETVTAVSTLQDTLALPARISSFETIKLTVTHPGQEVYNLYLGDRKLSANGVSGNVWIDRGDFNLDKSTDELVLSYGLRPKRFAIYKTTLRADSVTNATQKRTLAVNDTVWDKDNLQWIFRASRVGEYLVGFRIAGASYYYSGPSNWKADGTRISLYNTMDVLDISNQDTVAYEPILRKVPGYKKFQDTTSPYAITYKMDYSSGSDAMVASRYPLSGKTVQLYPTGIPADKIMHIYSDGVLRENYNVPVPWLPDTTADTIVIDLKPVFRTKDFLNVVVASPRTLYMGSDNYRYPAPAYPLQPIGDTLRVGEGDSLVLCHGGPSYFSVTTNSMRLYDYWRPSSDSLTCAGFAFPVFPPAQGGLDHGPFKITFTPYATTDYTVVRTVQINAPLAGVVLVDSITGKVYATGDTLHSNGFYGKVCLTNVPKDTNVYYSYMAKAPDGKMIANASMAVEKPCSYAQSFTLSEASTFGMDTLKITVTTSQRRRISVRLEPALSSHISKAFVQSGPSYATFDTHSWNVDGLLDTTFYNHYNVAPRLCLVPHDSIGLDVIRLGNYSKTVSPVYGSGVGDWAYCVPLDSTILDASHLTNGELIIGATLRSLPKVAFADSSSATEKLACSGMSSPQYLRPGVPYEISASNESLTSTITGFTVGGVALQGVSNRGAISFLLYGYYFRYDPATMKPTRGDTILISYVRTDNRLFPIALHDDFKAKLDTAWCVDIATKTTIPWCAGTASEWHGYEIYVKPKTGNVPDRLSWGSASLGLFYTNRVAGAYQANVGSSEAVPNFANPTGTVYLTTTWSGTN